MAEGAVFGGGFVDRNRFRTNFEQTSYTTREVKPMPARSSRPIRPSSYEPRQIPASPVVKKKLATLVMPEVAVAQPIASLSVPLTPLAKQEHRIRSFNPVSTIRRFKVKNAKAEAVNFVKTKTRKQLVLLTLASLMVIAGLYISFMGLQSDQAAHAQAVKLTQEANKAGGSPTSSSSAPALSTVKPSAKTYAAYAVAPNDPKYLKIPSIGVDSIVGQTGLLANGALGTPSNVYYTDWYTGSAAPGQPGATLIDGHVSSWTSKGVFYNLHALKAGDAIQVVKGDNSVVNYQVVKTQVYSSGDVDMQAAITPVVPGVSGLNLITCTGQVIKGTSQFNERVIVFAKQV